MTFHEKFTFFIVTLTSHIQRPELTAHCWQLVGKTNVYGAAPTYTNR